MTRLNKDPNCNDILDRREYIEKKLSKYPMLYCAALLNLRKDIETADNDLCKSMGGLEYMQHTKDNRDYGLFGGIIASVHNELVGTYEKIPEEIKGKFKKVCDNVKYWKTDGELRKEITIELKKEFNSANIKEYNLCTTETIEKIFTFFKDNALRVEPKETYKKSLFEDMKPKIEQITLF